MSNIVIWDPRNEYWEGALVDNETAHVLQSRGVALLPVDADHFRASAIAGYFKRSWGAGWPIGTAMPRFACPMVLYCYPQFRTLNFAARFVPESAEVLEQMLDGARPTGFVRLVTDSGQAFGHTGGLIPQEETVIEFRNLGGMDDYGGWTVIGKAKLDTNEAAPYALGLYGSAPGIRVHWSAVTQSP